MKLDRLKFARLVAMIASEYKYVHDDFIDALDRICDIDVTPVEVPGRANPADVNELMRAIHKGEKIAAIKAYRSLTGYGLKEAKDAVEKEWDTNTNKMINHIDKQLNGFDIHPNRYILEKFNVDQLKLVREFIKSFY